MATSISGLAERIGAAATDFAAQKPGSRESIIELSRKLQAELELPSEFVQRTLWAQPALSAILKCDTDINMFQHLRHADKNGLSLVDLAGKTKVEIELLRRLLLHLVAMNVLHYDHDRYFGTSLSNSLSETNLQESVKFCYDVARPSFAHLPDFFRETGYRTPSPRVEGPFQAAHNTALAFFPWLQATPPHAAQFDAFMSAYRAGRANWYDTGFYPVTRRLIEGFDSTNSDVLLVDVGGSHGHDIRLFKSKYPSHPGKIVLQDLESVISPIRNQEGSGFECQVHDFFNVQKIKAARAYFLHSILHDWDDEDAIKILENLKPALKPGYSRVLLNEIVLSEERPTIEATSMDMMMLAHFAVRERNEEDWRKIISKAGLELVQIYQFAGAAESVLEVELADTTA